MGGGGYTWKQAFWLRRKFFVDKETKHVCNVTCDMSFQNKWKIKQILLKQSRNKERFEVPFKCALNKEDQLNNENIQEWNF